MIFLHCLTRSVVMMKIELELLSHLQLMLCMIVLIKMMIYFLLHPKEWEELEEAIEAEEAGEEQFREIGLEPHFLLLNLQLHSEARAEVIEIFNQFLIHGSTIMESLLIGFLNFPNTGTGEKPAANCDDFELIDYFK